MGEMKAGDMMKGSYIEEKGIPFQVAEREFVNPGKGSAFVRLKLKNLRNGSVLKITHKSQDIVNGIDVSETSSQYLYSDMESYHFMNLDTYEQFEISKAAMPEKQYFMLDGESFKVVRWGEETLDIILPPKKDLIVAEAEDAVKGDSVNNIMKWAVTETGLKVKVPIFIKTGEKIRINVETQEYQERINS
jgi:elongation factor P